MDMVPFDFAGAGIEAVPLFQDRSVPGGPVAADTFAAQMADFMAALADAGPLDGVLLLMHGAMFVPGIDDPEGTFIADIRRLVGPEVIIAASFDLHGQVTGQIVEALDAFASYRTAPHIDVEETHARAALMLTDSLKSGTRSTVCWTPVPLLVSGEMSSTFVSPCDALYAALPDFDTRAGICDSNLMIGYVWADSPRATAAAVVTATDPVAGQQVADEIAQSYLSKRDELTYDMDAAPLQEALDRVAGTQAILADSGDNPTAGGVGDRADVLRAVLEKGLTSVLVAGIADPVAFDELMRGATQITLGGTLGGGGPKLVLPVEDCRLFEDVAVVTSQGVRVVVTQRRRPFHMLDDFKTLGLDLDAVSLLVVKSGYLVPELRALSRTSIMALTDGAVLQDVSRLENRYRPAGTWPFSHGA
ncbi:hypothetical protein AIOL_000874 [Candidatus Rhodobacter oscarellae]|uniref:MlrC n=1 Tax=Candidatus Rhodobacter oscarellae TaxID=1675527 RepID=A0A0J9EDC6_9RHOB|nr:hypothetical protein AIOL_000874 [Candidatus Rhodobacter lobularis]